MRPLLLASLLVLPLTLESQNSDSVRADSAFNQRDWRTLLRLAREHSLKGDVDAAFIYLDKLVPLRAIPVPILDTISDLASVRRDARYVPMKERMLALRYPCRTSPEARQFDFWIGEWDVTPFQAPPASNPRRLGTNRIQSLLEQCALLENWTDAAGGTGKSLNWYDTNRKVWRQAWVADGGGSTDYTGAFRDGAMRFEAATVSPAGVPGRMRMTFFPLHRDTVRQLIETSSDSGRTWQPGFDGRYVRRSR
jgi:hypothetical protein